MKMQIQQGHYRGNPGAGTTSPCRAAANARRSRPGIYQERMSIHGRYTTNPFL
jgi:hypothetical protein